MVNWVSGIFHTIMFLGSFLDYFKEPKNFHCHFFARFPFGFLKICMDSKSNVLEAVVFYVWNMQQVKCSAVMESSQGLQMS